MAWTTCGDVVDDAEVEDGVVRAVRRLDARGVPGPEPDPRAPPREAPPGERDHVGVEVEGIDPTGLEEVEDEPGADAAPAPDLERRGARGGPPMDRRRGASKWRCRAARTGLFIIAFSMRLSSMVVVVVVV